MKLTIKDNRKEKVRLGEIKIGEGIEVIDSDDHKAIYIKIGISNCVDVIVITNCYITVASIDLVNQLEGILITIEEITFLKG